MDTGNWIQLGVYVVTLIWGAATVRAELKYLRGDLDELKASVREGAHIVSTTLSDHGERISRIEGKLSDRI